MENTAINITNPTSGGLRSDSEGAGHFGAPRGYRIHTGMDITCAPGQLVKAPITGRVTRFYQVYGDDTRKIFDDLAGRDPDVNEWGNRLLDLCQQLGTCEGE